MYYFLPLTAVILLILSCSSPRLSLPRPSKSTADRQLPAAFKNRLNLTEALVLDDQTAWNTSDSLSAQDTLALDSLDETWFIYGSSTKRYAFYGRYLPEQKRYFPKYAFSSDLSGSIKRMSTNNVPETINDYAKAVATGVNHFKTILDSLGFDVEYNHYIRRNSDSTYAMWFFPAGYDNYCAQGLDINLSINEDGQEVVKQSITGQFIRYFELNKPDQTVTLDNTSDTLPSIGNLFFSLVNRTHFKSITITCSGGSYSTIYDPDHRKWIWIRTEKKNDNL